MQPQGDVRMDRIPMGNRLPIGVLLSFSDPECEKAFIDYYVGFYYRYAQASLVLGIVLVFGDFVVDYFAHPEVRANFLRIWVCLPILFSGLAYSFLSQAKRNWQPAMSAFIVAIALALFWILLRIDDEGGAGLKSWVGVLNFTFLEFYCFVILGVQFRYALIAGIVILAVFEAAMWFAFGIDRADVAYWTYHVVTVFILSAGIGWWREYLLRMEYLARTSLEAARLLADRLSKAKSDFLANMSHEIRTPMNGILGLAHLLRRDGVTPKQAQRLDKIDAAAEHLLTIINDVLDLSKIEAGRLSLDNTDFLLSALLGHVASIVEQPAQAKGIAIAVDHDDVPLWLHGDLTRLRQALLNYASNAVKFTEKGSIALRAKLLEEKGDDLLVRFEVEDTGVGIAPEAMARIFQAFEQAETSTTRRYGGTGLGLSITQRLAQLMGGKAGADSALGRGSIFWFTARLQDGRGAMPAAATANMANAEAQLRLHHAGARLLLVEDDVIAREVVTELLHGAGLLVDTAVDGLEAVSMAQAQEYDLILMDMQMPNLDGPQATRAIRRLSGWEAKPIVAMTANAFHEDRFACEEAGMNDFISKPANPELIYATLLKWLPTATVSKRGGSNRNPGQSLAANAPAALAPARTTAPELGASTEAALARVAGVPGMNVARAIAGMRGHAADYLCALERFVRSHADDMTRIDASLAEGEHAAVQRMAHSLKGT
ncbi:MAG: response regulator [Burkholderiales bacterium]|jgi:signal transduction histidine kinase/DNA-binding NarL/FixJ family response regulator